MKSLVVRFAFRDFGLNLINDPIIEFFMDTIVDYAPCNDVIVSCSESGQGQTQAR
jgi:hypothetical protein